MVVPADGETDQVLSLQTLDSEPPIDDALYAMRSALANVRAEPTERAARTQLRAAAADPQLREQLAVLLADERARRTAARWPRRSTTSSQTCSRTSIAR